MSGWGNWGSAPIQDDDDSFELFPDFGAPTAPQQPESAASTARGAGQPSARSTGLALPPEALGIVPPSPEPEQSARARPSARASWEVDGETPTEDWRTMFGSASGTQSSGFSHHVRGPADVTATGFSQSRDIAPAISDIILGADIDLSDPFKVSDALTRSGRRQLPADGLQRMGSMFQEVEDDNPEQDSTAVTPAQVTFSQTSMAPTVVRADPRLKKQVRKLKNMVLDLRSDKRKLRQELSKLTVQNEQLMEFVDQKAALITEQNAQRVAKQDNSLIQEQLKLHEARRKREEERRLALEQGAFEGGGDEVFFAAAGEGASFWKRIFSALTVLSWRLQYYAPLAGDVRWVRINYGDAVATFFRFSQWLVYMSLLMCVFMQITVAPHIMNWETIMDEAVLYDNQTQWTGVHPYPFRYISYGSDESFWYSFTVVFFVFVSMLFMMFKSVGEDKRKKREDVFAMSESDQGTRFARSVLNAWDWNLYEEFQVTQQQQQIVETVLTLWAESEVQEKKRQASLKGWTLVARRVMGNVFVVLLIAITWSILLLLILNEQTLVDALSNIAFLSTISTYITSLSISIMNQITPQMVVLITSFEQWEDPGHVARRQTTLLYMLKISNLAVIAYGYFNYVSQSFDPLLECRMDTVSTQLANLVLTNFLIDKVSSMFMVLMRRIMARIRPKKAVHADFDPESRFRIAGAAVLATIHTKPGEPTPEGGNSARSTTGDDGSGLGNSEPEDNSSGKPKLAGPDPIAAPGPEKKTTGDQIQLTLQAQLENTGKAEFRVSFYTIRIIYEAALVWISFPLYPAVSMFAFIFSFIQFYWDKMMLTNFLMRPQQRWSGSAISSLFMTLYSITFALCAVIMWYIMVRYDHVCGPHESGTIVAQLESWIREQAISTWCLENLMGNTWLAWGLVFTAFSYLIMNINHVVVLKEYIFDKAQQVSEQISTLQHALSHKQKILEATQVVKTES